MKQNREYWRERFEKLEDMQHGKAVKYSKELEKAYTSTLDSIEKDILKWYNRFAVNNEITLEEARKRLNANELREFKWTVDEYIKYGEANAVNGKWMKQLENASARVHISRLEALFVQFSNHANVLYDGELQGLTELLSDVYLDQYNRVAYTVQTGTNVGFALAAIPDEVIATVLNKPWSPDGRNFSQRIWSDRENLVKVLQTELIQGVTLGKSPKEIAQIITKKMGGYNPTTKKYSGMLANAVRLVQTEQAAFVSRSTEYSYKELSVEQYEYISTLDSKTSEICQDMDGKVFEMSEYEVGVTAPTLHVNCRSATAPYIEDNEDYGERVARDKDGQRIYVPGNMKYADWYEKYGVK